MGKLRQSALKVAALAALIVIPATLLVSVSPLGEAFAAKRSHRALKHRDDLPKLAATMRALMAVGGTGILRKDEPGFPDDFAKIGARWVHFGPEEVSVEFGGGFYHYGYRLAATSGAGLQLFCYGEYPEDEVPLLRLPGGRPAP